MKFLDPAWDGIEKNVELAYKMKKDSDRKLFTPRNS